MMKTKLLFTLVASLALVGCKDFSSSRGVIKTAGDAVKKGDLVTLRSTLSGKALAQWGSEDGLAKLQKQTSGVKKLKLNKPHLISQQIIDSTKWNEQFKVSVLGDSKPIAQATTFCKNKKHLVISHNCHSVCHHNGNTVVCHDSCHPTSHFEVATSCKITDLVLQ